MRRRFRAQSYTCSERATTRPRAAMSRTWITPLTFFTRLAPSALMPASMSSNSAADLLHNAEVAPPRTHAARGEHAASQRGRRRRRVWRREPGAGRGGHTRIESTSTIDTKNGTRAATPRGRVVCDVANYVQCHFEDQWDSHWDIVGVLSLLPFLQHASNDATVEGQVPQGPTLAVVVGQHAIVTQQRTHAAATPR